MASFPILRSGAVCQHPFAAGTRFQTQAVRFLDGSQQKFPIYGRALRRWTVQLALLDDAELAALTAFAEQQGTALFSFTDPATGSSFNTCRMGGDRFDSTGEGEGRNSGRLVIEEVA